jgi:hypothetical protein
MHPTEDEDLAAWSCRQGGPSVALLNTLPAEFVPSSAQEFLPCFPAVENRGDTLPSNICLIAQERHDRYAVSI